MTRPVSREKPGNYFFHTFSIEMKLITLRFSYLCEPRKQEFICFWVENVRSAETGGVLLANETNPSMSKRMKHRGVLAHCLTFRRAQQ